MVRDINGLGNYSNQTTTAADKTNGKTASAQKPAETDSNSTPSGDEVQLSSSAKSLSALADSVNQLPEVNIARAEQIKAALESGEYRIDDLVLADKIINSESLLLDS
jgi:negative regulator of flagellin synthesis FlgM